MGIINKRKIGLAIFISLITLGIYGIYWKYLLVKNCRTIIGDIKKCTGEMICFILLPFYSLYWWYTKGETVRNEFSKQGNTVLGTGKVYLFLCVFGLEIVAMAIMQNDFNSLPNEGSNRNKKLIFNLSECAIMIALATVLSLIKVVQLPLGGAITLLSMLPIIIISVSLGIKWGLSSAFVYSLIQFVFGITTDGILGWGLDLKQLTECILLDYIAAFTVLGIAGVFRKVKFGAVFGTVLALTLRFLCHFTSGYIIFAHFEEFVVFGKTFVERPFLYSVCYNGAYMLPELVITCIAVFVLSKAKFFERIEKTQKT